MSADQLLTPLRNLDRERDSALELEGAKIIQAKDALLTPP
jgi:hypothetical protein